jgi:hypothetical protein
MTESAASLNDGGGWQSMKSAPRDGTIIETKCSAGTAPWYGLHRWTGDKQFLDLRTGERDLSADGKASWVDAQDAARGVAESPHLQWRPYTGTVADYVDPTAGYQYDPRYWREAVARKYGYPPDHFEHGLPEPEGLVLRPGESRSVEVELHPGRPVEFMVAFRRGPSLLDQLWGLARWLKWLFKRKT